MKLVKANPFNGFDTMVRRMNNMFNTIENGGSLMNSDAFFNTTTLTPRVDISEDKANYYIHAELPGMTKDDVKVAVNEGGILTISGEKKHEEKKEDKNYYRIERRYGQFSRSFTLPEHVDDTNIDAKFENGVLNLSIPKVEPAKPNVKEITVR